MKTKKEVSHLHEEHNDWVSRLLFYRDELKIMKNRIIEISVKYSSKEIQAMVDHFQNQFIIQEEQIHKLEKQIEKEERKLQLSAVINPDKAGQEAVDFNRTEREAMRTCDKLFIDLKHELNAFLVKWM